MPAAVMCDIAAEGMGFLRRLRGTVVISLNVTLSISLYAGGVCSIELESSWPWMRRSKRSMPR
jgi:hypothetical protein